MKQMIILFLVIALSACDSGLTNKVVREDSKKGLDSIHTETRPESVLVDSMNVLESEYATCFAVIADTSLDYYFLHKKMIDLNATLKISIDTMGRYYNKEKNLISLPDNDEDEMYAGDYFPRRYSSDKLSLEYLVVYQRQTRKKTIALVTGIYETEKVADSVMAVIQKREKGAFKIKANLYMGCMH